jgi:PEP-CTERM motif-containing protein
MLKISAVALAAALALSALPAKAATQITVENVGSILNQSLALPAQFTPGSGIGFEQFFEFTLPVAESVTLSVSDSATGNQRITGGSLSFNTWTSTAPVSPFQPIGSLLESASLIDFLGGQSATVDPTTVGAGSYFALVSGISGGSPIHIAIDGTVTAISTPEPATWAMLAIGFGLMGFAGLRSRKGRLVDLA